MLPTALNITLHYIIFPLFCYLVCNKLAATATRSRKMPGIGVGVAAGSPKLRYSKVSTLCTLL